MANSIPQDVAEKLLSSLQNLVLLHDGLDKGNCYITVAFKARNDAAIERAKQAIAEATNDKAP